MTDWHRLANERRASAAAALDSRGQHTTTQLLEIIAAALLAIDARLACTQEIEINHAVRVEQQS